MAAPNAPIRGIRIKFMMNRQQAAIIIEFLVFCSRPHIMSEMPTGPISTLYNWPTDIMLSIGAASENSLPNRPVKNAGNSINARKTGVASMPTNIVLFPHIS